MVAGCVPAGGAPATVPASLPPMRWDHRAEAPGWTAAALSAVSRHDDVLASRVPADIETWCPGYETASLPERRAFWVGMMSALAKHESGWNPAAAGGGGKWIGLMQISPKTARGHGCSAQSAGALKDGAANLDCAVSIFAGDVARDGVVAGGGKRGMGRDWAPFRKGDKRADMAAWTSAQPYCAKG
ncbi:MAG: transglycosylase SLT domain-containing protein [Paracoccaceae bacterium]